MNNYVEVINLLKQAKSVAVFMHINPDCDCIGSAIALSLFLKKTGKIANFFSPDLTSTQMISPKYNFLPHFELFNATEAEEYDLSVGVDVGDAGRLGEIAFKKFVKSKKNLVIDHHEIHEDFAQVTLRESDSASTTQILYKLMREYNVDLIDKEIATLLYAGIVTDSGGFSFECTTAETYSIAGKLVEFGINNSLICEKLMKDILPNVYILKNRILSNTKFYENGRIGVIVFRLNDFAETGTTEKDTDGLINNVQNVVGVDLAISIAEVDDKKYKLSFRSKNNVNAAACAKCFGGGGHYRAAGCRLYGYFEDVYDKVVAVAKEMLDND